MPLDTMSTQSDDQLLSAYGAGDPAAARALTLRLTPRVLAHATRMLGGDRAEAEDVTQEAMLRLWRGAPDWQDGGAQVRTWIYRVTANLCIDRIRKRRDTSADAVDTLIDDAASAVDRLQNATRMDALNWALSHLPDRQRQAVVLRHIEGLTNPEIAQVMECGVEAVESLTSRGKRKLSDLLMDRRAALGYEDEVHHDP